MLLLKQGPNTETESPKPCLKGSLEIRQPSSKIIIVPYQDVITPPPSPTHTTSRG